MTWVGNGLPVVFAPHVYHSADAWTVDLSNPNSPTQWFQDRATVDVLDPSDGELTRARDKIAVVRGPNTKASPIADGTGDCGAAAKRLIAGGSQPDWGPASR